MNGLIKCVGGLYRIKEFDIQYVLETFTKFSKKPIAIEIDGFTYAVKTGSMRYHLFKKKGLTCVHCKRMANKCFLEISPGQGNSAHFNFYEVVEGKKDRLFTKDHIIPKALGGKDKFNNYQPMCTNCNGNKGAKLPNGGEI